MDHKKNDQIMVANGQVGGGQRSHPIADCVKSDADAIGRMDSSGVSCGWMWDGQVASQLCGSG